MMRFLGWILSFLLSIAGFIVLMVLSLFAFTYTAINHPSTMRDLMTYAQQVRDYVREGPLPDSYMVWVDIYMQPAQIVLVGFSIAMRILIGIVKAFLDLIFGPRPPASAASAAVAASPAPASNSPFGSWG